MRQPADGGVLPRGCASPPPPAARGQARACWRWICALGGWYAFLAWANLRPHCLLPFCACEQKVTSAFGAFLDPVADKLMVSIFYSYCCWNAAGKCVPLICLPAS